MKSLSVLLLAAGLSSAKAADLSIEIQNLTQGIYFTPLLVAAHDSNADVYDLGEAASSEVRAIAEGGDISGLQLVLDNASASIAANPAGGLLAPGASTSIASLNTDGTQNSYLSIIAMMLPTNDGFVGLDAWPIPSAAGTYTVYLNAYDAGTEANDELLNPETGGVPGSSGIPAAPGQDAGANGVGVTAAENNQTVHVHRGVVGDDDPNGGASDLDLRIHRWLNPVAKLTITVR